MLKYLNGDSVFYSESVGWGGGSGVPQVSSPSLFLFFFFCRFGFWYKVGLLLLGLPSMFLYLSVCWFGLHQKNKYSDIECVLTSR